MHTKFIILFIIISGLLISGAQGAAEEQAVITTEVVTTQDIEQSQLEIFRHSILEDRNEEIRLKAANLLLADESQTARDILVEIMRTSTNPPARISVCKAISSTRRQKTQIPNKSDFIEPLVSILVTSEQPDEVKVAAEAMLVLDYNDVSKQLERTASDPSSPIRARLNAIYALKLQPDMRATIQIIRLIDDPDSQVSKEAQKALQSLGIAYGENNAQREAIIADMQERGEDEFLKERLIVQESIMDSLDSKMRFWRERYLAGLDKLYATISDDIGKGQFLAEYLADKEPQVRLWALNKIHQWWVGTEPGTNLLVELGPVLINLLKDPDRDVRLKTATLLSYMSKLEAAAALAEQFKLENDDQVKTELFVALGWSSNLSSELRKQTLLWAEDYLANESPQKAQKGAEVMKKLLESDGLEEQEVDYYLGLISERYQKQKQISENGLCSELLGTMAGMCGQSYYRSRAANLYAPLFEDGLASSSDLIVQKAIDGLITIDKNTALKRLRDDFVNHKSIEVRRKLIALADEVGGSEDLLWLSEKIGSNSESKPAWQAMLNIFKRSDLAVSGNWLEPLREKHSAEKLTDAQMLAFLETAQAKIAVNTSNGLLKDIQEEMAELYKSSGDYEQAAKYYGLLLKAEPPIQGGEKEKIISSLLDVYLRWQKMDSAGELIANCLLEGDINDNSQLSETLNNYLANLPPGIDPNTVLTRLGQIPTGQDRPMWAEQIKRWLEQYVKVAEPNQPEMGS